MSPAGKGRRDRCELVVIGGTGWDEPDFLTDQTIVEMSTPFSDWPLVIQRGRLGGNQIAFVARHGADHSVPPHRVNYRANVWAAAQLHPGMVVAINVVGSLNPRLPPGRLVLPHQVVDYTWGREHSFVGNLQVPMHIDFTHPFDEKLRARLKAADRDRSLAETAAVYGVTQGPRLETRAEIARLKNDGCDLVGMTAMPEAALARELGLSYACICVVANWAAGIGGTEPITMEQIAANVESARAPLLGLLRGLLRR